VSILLKKENLDVILITIVFVLIPVFLFYFLRTIIH